LPVIVYTGKDLTHEEEKQLKLYAQSIILKSEPSSPGRLIDESALFLHRVVESLSPQAKAAIHRSSGQEAVLQGKNVLVVDDDIRNIFAITSVLESFGMVVTFADNGKAALKKLKEIDNVDIILMDVMMPEMDGYDAIRAIRQNPAFQSLPIIAVTAKALKDDRANCVAAGASDYLAKPVDTDKLLELMRLWLRR
jgi:CheY-like chemotaxis protein